MARRARRLARNAAHVHSAPPLDHRELLRRRAARHARAGDHRKAALALRELCASDGDAATWTLLGDMLRRARRLDDALVAWKQAHWLHTRAGATGRARTVARMILELPGPQNKN